MTRRGQATVELALGGTLLVATVMLGLWLTEVSFLTVKVQEASSAAVWDATGRPLDDYEHPANGNAPGNYAQLLAQVGQDVGNRYRDFDALGGGSNGTARVFTQGKQLEVRCVATPAGGPAPMAFNLPGFTEFDDRTGVVPGRVNGLLRQWYQPRGATVCTASAQATAWQLPKTFADRSEGGFFTRFREDRVLQLCGVGKAVGTSCPAGHAVLLGDWALDGEKGRPIVRDSVLVESAGVGPGDVNGPYLDMVRRLFVNSGEGYGANQPGSGASGRFASRLGWQRPPGSGFGHSDRKFYMSYAGSEHDYGDMLEWRVNPLDPSCRQCHFNTTGTQPAVGNPAPSGADDWRRRRKPCFLGLGGCR